MTLVAITSGAPKLNLESSNFGILDAKFSLRQSDPARRPRRAMYSQIVALAILSALALALAISVSNLRDANNLLHGSAEEAEVKSAGLRPALSLSRSEVGFEQSFVVYGWNFDSNSEIAFAVERQSYGRIKVDGAGRFVQEVRLLKDVHPAPTASPDPMNDWRSARGFDTVLISARDEGSHVGAYAEIRLLRD
ncbi:hypothetical protein [Micromonospora gifhornensis]|uniref:hypothetical protein n=1 Tax=Micromonospora gifhornensis TaxID=84594 RepID=UPI003D747FB5